MLHDADIQFQHSGCITALHMGLLQKGKPLCYIHFDAVYELELSIDCRYNHGKDKNDVVINDVADIGNDEVR